MRRGIDTTDYLVYGHEAWIVTDKSVYKPGEEVHGILRWGHYMRPDAPLREFAEACGFRSLGCFGKVFRQATGFTSQGYRLSLIFVSFLSGFSRKRKSPANTSFACPDSSEIGCILAFFHAADGVGLQGRGI